MAEITETRSEPFYRGLIEGMRCGILAIDREGRLQLANEQACQILELRRPPEPGDSVEEALGEHPQLARILREAFSMSSLPNRAEIDLKVRSDKGKTIGFTLSLVPGNGTPAGAAIFFKDLTHVEHKEEQERLRDRLAALGQMAANLAHEIRNPLASIEVTCSLLKRRIPREAEGGKELLDKIIAEVRRLNRTITSSLEFVKPLSLNLAPGRLEPVLDEAVQVAVGRSGKAGIRVERSYPGDLPAFLMDRAQLRQVFENLFLNAMEAMGERGVLSIATATAVAPAAPSIPYRPGGAAAGDPWQGFERYAVVRVADTGPGIAEEHLDKLFYPFFTTKKQGSGVGLSMAKKIVDSHRGLIDVESQPGGGAVFTVRLPLVAPYNEE